jgi:hypothetical protein
MRIQRYLILFVTGIVIATYSLSLVSASSAMADISHSYHSTDSIMAGSVVSLDPQRSDYVEPANTSNGSRVIGVAVQSNSSLLALDPSSSTIQVAIEGAVNALVSTVNGNVNIGDDISASPFDGVGMKAPQGAHVIGIAQQSLSLSTQGATSEQVTDKSGHKAQIEVGYVRVDIATGVNGSANANNYGGLERIAEDLTGHNVSAIRIALCLIVALLTIISLTVLIYTSIHGSLVSIGRNPLARHTVFRTLGSVFGMILIMAALACLAMYALLR